jgi:hypothetical protein
MWQGAGNQAAPAHAARPFLSNFEHTEFLTDGES